MKIRTRFAPSPTGDLHIGSVRTALYNYLFARRNHGEFLLRIEDTDRERSTEESTQVIYQGLNWLGLTWDHPQQVWHQMDRLSRYQELAQNLIKTGNAYRCNCSKERLVALRESQLSKQLKPRYDGYCRLRQAELSNLKQDYVIRFANPTQGQVVVNDLIYGQVNFENSELDDLVLIRSDGVPTYNFAVVVDDNDQKITHVIRGDDHLNNTPRQINLYKALQFDLPIFAHIPMILDPSGKKMSKRDSAASILFYKNLGILPEALLNYLVRLGWSDGDQEIFTLNQMIEKFDFANVHKSGAKFDINKLTWINQHYLKELNAETFWNDFSANNPKWLKFKNKVLEIFALYKARVSNLSELNETISLYLNVDYKLNYQKENLDKFYTAKIKQIKPVLELILESFSTINLADWQAVNLQNSIKQIAKQNNLNFPDLAQPLRIAITGDINSPGIGDTLELAGKDLTIMRIKYLIG